MNIVLPSIPITIGNERNRKIRYVIAGVCFFLIFVLSYLYEMDKDYLVDENYQIIVVLSFLGRLGYLPRSIISGTLLMIAALCGIEPEKKPVSVNLWMPYLWLLMNATFIIAGLFHDIQEGFVFSQITVFLAVPIFFIGWMSSGHLKDLYTVFSLAITVFTFLVVLFCIIWFPYGDIAVYEMTDAGELIQTNGNTVFFADDRYMGMMDNPSRVAHFATQGAICSLYLIFVWKNWKTVFPAITLGSSMAMAVLAISRASMLSITLAVIGFVILYIRMGKSRRKLAAVALITVLAFTACFMLVNRGQDHYHLFSKGTLAEAVYAETESEDAEDIMLEEGPYIGDRFKASGTVNSISSGRIFIWRAFISRLNLAGHDVRFDYPVKIVDSDYNGYYYFSYPHNVALDYAYRCGILTGVLFLLLEIMGYIYCGRTLFTALSKRKSRIDEGEVFAVMGLMAFLITGNVESVDHVFTRVILVVFYLSLVPVFSGGGAVDCETN